MSLSLYKVPENKAWFVVPGRRSAVTCDWGMDGRLGHDVPPENSGGRCENIVLWWWWQFHNCMHFGCYTLNWNRNFAFCVKTQNAYLFFVSIYEVIILFHRLFWILFIVVVNHNNFSLILCMFPKHNLGKLSNVKLIT